MFDYFFINTFKKKDEKLKLVKSTTIYVNIVRVRVNQMLNNYNMRVKI